MSKSIFKKHLAIVILLIVGAMLCVFSANGQDTLDDFVYDNWIVDSSCTPTYLKKGHMINRQFSEQGHGQLSVSEFGYGNYTESPFTATPTEFSKYEKELLEVYIRMMSVEIAILKAEEAAAKKRDDKMVKMLRRYEHPRSLWDRICIYYNELVKY